MSRLNKDRIWFVVFATVLSAAMSGIFAFLAKNALYGLFLFPFIWVAIFLMGWYRSITGESVDDLCIGIMTWIKRHERLYRFLTVGFILLFVILIPGALVIWVKPVWFGVFVFVVAVVIWIRDEFAHAGSDPEERKVKQ